MAKTTHYLLNVTPRHITVFHTGVAREAAAFQDEQAAQGIGYLHVINNSFTEVPTSTLVQLYNQAAVKGQGRTITKFADRQTAERRMEGILDFLSEPLPKPQPVVAPTPKTKGAPKKEIPEALLQQVVALRQQGIGWMDLIAQLKQPYNFIFRVRPVLKERYPDMVRALGPGSPNYGKKEVKPRASTRRERKPSAPVVEF